MPNDSKSFFTPEVLALMTGVSVGGAYVLLKVVGLHGGLSLFGVGSLICGLAMAAFAFNDCRSYFLSRQLIWRGALFALTQLLICESIRLGSATAAINTSIVGSLCGVFLGRFLLKERISGPASFGLVFSLFGAFLSAPMAAYTLLGAAGGAVMGINSTALRALLRTGSVPSMAAVAIPLVYGGLAMTGAAFLLYGSDGFYGLNLSSLWFIASLGVTQLLTVAVAKRLDSQKTAVLTLMRLPSGGVFEIILLGAVFEMNQMIGMFLVVVGAAITLKFKTTPPILTDSKNSSSPRGTLTAQDY